MDGTHGLMMVTFLFIVVLLAALAGYVLVPQLRRAEATVAQLLRERDDALQQLAAEQSDTRVWPRVADLSSQLAAASGQAIAWQAKSVAAAATVRDLRQALVEAQAHATPVGRSAPRPIETHDTWTLRLCDAHGRLRTEVSLHRADAPDTYVYGGVRYRALGRVGRVVNFQEVLPHG